jgi:endonuclease G
MEKKNNQSVKSAKALNPEVSLPGSDGIAKKTEKQDIHLGYKSNFIGTEVPIPKLSPEQKKNVAKPKGSLTLDYTHFSICMNQKRRLAYFTAVNIDGSGLKKIIRKRDKWTFDERINETFQCGNDIYKKNKLDKGHLVRRLDPCWGPDEIAKKAETDTFHYTNAAPQFEILNRQIWNDLEDYILANTDKNNLKINVFTGEVFDENKDPHYRDIQIPLRFWKVVTMTKENKELSATAYILDQEEEIGDMVKPRFVFGEFRTYQTSISEIEQLTSLDFGYLKKYDPKAIIPKGYGVSPRTHIDSLDKIVF